MSTLTLSSVITTPNPSSPSATDTKWFFIGGCRESVDFMITGSGTWSVRVHYSNSADYDKGSDYVTDDFPFTAATGPRALKTSACDYVGFSMPSWMSGSAKISFGKGVDASGRKVEIALQGNKTPPPTSRT